MPWHEAGYKGQGVKVGIIETGFEGFGSLIGKELPSPAGIRCYTDSSIFSSDLKDCENGDTHGTKTAETIIDVAPEISLYIARPQGRIALRDTVDWMAEEGVSVAALYGFGSFEGPGDGSSPNSYSVFKSMDRGVDGGIIFIVPAANNARNTWYKHAPFSDADGDAFIDFAGTDDGNGISLEKGESAHVQLRWDDAWPGASRDLDFHIWDTTAQQIIAHSRDQQSGRTGDIPYERLRFEAPRDGEYEVRISHQSGSVPDWIQLLAWNQRIEHYTESGSIQNLAESANPGVLAVGAAHWDDVQSIEWYSSRGPTPDGRIKPDIVGATCGEVATGGSGTYCGTSGSTPHVTGMAALVKQRFPDYTPVQVADYLKRHAEQRGTPDPNNTWGHGFAVLPPPNAEPPPGEEETATGTSGTMPPNFKVALIGDQGLGRDAEAVLQMIKDEGTDMVLHQGDFDYQDDPDAWDDMITKILGADYPYFGSVGNHEDHIWDDYQRKLEQRLARIEGAWCSGDLGVNSYCTYKGLFFVLSGVGAIDTGRASYIKEALASDAARKSVWRVCSWHENQRLMQVGGKRDTVGWEPYEECRKAGAMIATGHEHSYSRTHLLDNFETQSIAATSDVLNIDRGKSFAFVSGIAGHSIRGQDDRLAGKPWWASVYTSEQGADFGALFCVLNYVGVEGVENLGYCYFKDLSGVIADAFGLIVGPVDKIPDAALFVPARTPIGEAATHEGDRAELVAFYNATGGDDWTDNTKWLSDAPIGEWYGITTDASGRVIVMDLHDYGLSGQLPSGLSNLANLKRLLLSDNRLSGEIPPELGSLTRLEQLELDDNELTGEIPSELGNLANLSRLELDDNGLTGAIPSELGNLTYLNHLELNGNRLTGAIPPSLGNLTKLRNLWLTRGNRFTGCVPTGLMKVANHDLDDLGLPSC